MKRPTTIDGQVDMFDPGLPVPDIDFIGAFHRDASDTERDAALDILPKTGTQRRRVLELLALRRERGATHWEVTDALGSAAQHTGFGARINELCRLGWLQDSGIRRAEKTGKQAIVWELTPEGAARLPELRRTEREAKAG